MFSKVGEFTYRLFAAWMNKTIEPPDRHMSNLAQALTELRASDVVLVEGRSRVAGIIKTITQTNWTHAAMYVGRICDQDHPHLKKLLRQHHKGAETDHLLVEAELGSGTIITPIDKYFDYHVRICRPKALTPEDTELVLIHALERIGIEYDVRHLLDLARWFYPYFLLPRRWRSCLFEQDIDRGRTRTICSTLLVDAFYSVDFPIRPDLVADESGELRLSQANARMCTPRDFDTSPYFDIIKYPLIQLQRKGVYRRLPWMHRSKSLVATLTIPLAKGLLVADVKKGPSHLQRATENVYTWYHGMPNFIQHLLRPEFRIKKGTEWIKGLIRLPASR